MPANQASLAAYVRLLRENSNFRRLWLAQIVSEIGDWFYILSIYSLLLQLTGKAQSVGLAVVLQVLPQTLVSPTAGVVLDRVSRRRVMIAADLARMVIVSGMMLARSKETIWLVYPLLFLETVMWGFFEPARSAVIPNVVGEDDVLVANTVSSMTWSFNFAVGSGLGGLAAVLLGRDAVFVLNALSFLTSALLIRRMKFHEPHAAGTPPFHLRELVDFSPIVEGARYIRKDLRMLVTVMLKGGVGMLGANWVIFPILGERVFPVRLSGIDIERGAVLGMSFLMGARGLGALFGPLSASRWASGSPSRMRKGIVLAFVAAAVGYMALAAAPDLLLACAAVVLAHGGASVVWVFSTTLLQQYSDDRFRGRVFSVDLSFCMTAIALTSYAASVAVDHGISVREVAFVNGVAMLLPATAWLCALRLWREKRSPAVP